MQLEQGKRSAAKAITLRDYQSAAVDEAWDKLRAHGSALMVMATGLGKTVVFSAIIRRVLERGIGRVLVIAHREELIMQAASTIGRCADVAVGVEMGEMRVQEDVFRRDAVIVSSIQTQISGAKQKRRMHRFDPNQFALVIIDEAHHACAHSYRELVNYYRANRQCMVLGVTATPDRTDEAALGEVFASSVKEVGIRDGIEGGWLVPITQRIVHVGALDFSTCRTTAGDLNGADLDAALSYEETLHGMVYPTIEIVGDRRCVVFTASVAHAHRVAEIINRHRAGSAVAVDASTKREDRREAFAGFAEGRYQFLVNVGVATEGWDDAALDGKGVQVIAMMRPTKSRALYCQMIGRGTRPIPNTVDNIECASARREAIAASAKPRLVVLDFCGNAGKHKLVHCVDALGGNSSSDAVKARAERKVMRDAADSDIDVLAALDAAEVAEREAQQRKQRSGIVVQAHYSTQEIDPFSLIALSPDRAEAWAKGVPATEKQTAFLRRMKVGLPDLLTKREATQLIDAMMSTPSPKQAAMLERNGLDPAQYDRRSASEAIAAIMKGVRR